MFLLAMVLSIAQVNPDAVTPEILQKITKEGKANKLKLTLKNTYKELLADAEDGVSCSTFNYKTKEEFEFVKADVLNKKFQVVNNSNTQDLWLKICW